MRLAKSRLVAIYPTGREYTIHRKQGAWWWDQGKGSHPLSAAIENVEREGGRVERRALPQRALQPLARELGRWLG